VADGEYLEVFFGAQDATLEEPATLAVDIDNSIIKDFLITKGLLNRAAGVLAFELDYDKHGILDGRSSKFTFRATDGHNILEKTIKITFKKEDKKQVREV
jgi:hypothetical protein